MSEAVLTEAEPKQQEKQQEKQNNQQSHTHGRDESMIVRLSSLDNMLELAGEVIIVSSNLNAISRQMREGTELSHDMAGDIRDLAITSQRISSDLHNLVSNVRTVGMSDLFARFRRLARDTSRRLGKAVRFELEGEEVSIDKKLSEKIYDPIAHQIRNSIAHGIEDEQTRRAKGKDPVGTVKLTVKSADSNTIIEVSDDGAGIDTEKIRTKIVEMGLTDGDSALRMSDIQLYDYLFLPGFSTAQQTTNSSGRGVGLDVIKTVMNEINGETKIESTKDTGTTFSFVLPIVTAVNISDSLLVRANKTYFAFPILSVVASISVAKSDVATTAGRGRTIFYLGNILPLFDLLEVFGETPVDEQSDEYRIIIIEYKHKRVAYVVSDFLSPQKIVISEFDGGISVPGLLGTALLSGRQMAMVVDLQRLFEQTVGKQQEIDLGFEGTNTLPDSDVTAADMELRLPDKSVMSQPSEKTPQTTEYGGLEIEQTDSTFLQEIESMLAQLNRELLELDEKRDAETAQSIFRLMHSIKGNFTMCGAETPAEIAHKNETVLEAARKGELEFADEIFDVLFDSSAYLEEVVAAYLKEQKAPPVPEKLSAGLAKFTEKQKEQSETASENTDFDQAVPVLDATGQFYLSSRRREGTQMYLCKMDFDPADQPAFLVAYLILRKIQGVADVLGTLPAMSDIETGLCGNTVAALFAPRSDDPRIIEKLSEVLKRYYGVTRFEAAPYA